MARSGSILDLMSEDIKTTVSTVASELRKGEDRVRELRSEEDRLKQLVVSLNAEIETIQTKKVAREAEVAALDKIVEDRLASAEAKIAASYAALSERDAQVSGREQDAVEKTAAAESTKSKARAAVGEMASKAQSLKDRVAKSLQAIGREADELSEYLDSLTQ